MASYKSGCRSISEKISFDFHGPGWDPDVITHLGDTLIEFADLFSTSPTDFGSCFFLPFEISVPPDSSPVTSRPYRVNALVAKQNATILDECLATGLIQHSTSLCASPVVLIPKNLGEIRLTINFPYPASTKSSTSWAQDGRFPSSI